MKRIKPILSAVLALALVLSMLTVPAFADETGYEPANSYVLNFNGVYEGCKWQYFSPYWPAFTYDGSADYTQSISFTLYNTVSGEGFPILRPGANAISFDGGITSIEVMPRWVMV